MGKIIEDSNLIQKEKKAVSIYSAVTNEKLASFDSIKNCANHLGVNGWIISGIIRDKYRFGARRKKGRKYKYDFPILIKYD